MTNPSQLVTIDLLGLSSVTGGVSLDIHGTVSAKDQTASVGAKFDSGAPGAMDPDTQLRCYGQVARQAGWFQAPRETLRQQLELCGPLRQPTGAASAAR